MMMQSGQGKNEKIYKNTVHCAASIYHQEGACAFYKGAFTNVLRGMCSAFVLVLYDELQNLSTFLIDRLVDAGPATEMPSLNMTDVTSQNLTLLSP